MRINLVSFLFCSIACQSSTQTLLAAASIVPSMEGSRNACRVVILPPWEGVDAAVRLHEKNKPEWADQGCYSPGGWDLRLAPMGILASVSAQFREVTHLARCTATDRIITHPDKYLIDLDHNLVRHATADEWAKAPAEPPPYYPTDDPVLEILHVIGFPPRNDRTAIFHGRSFPKSGKEWPAEIEAARLSRNVRYLALNSWDGYTEIRRDPFTTSHYPRPIAREIYTDVYDTESGRLLFTVNAHIRGNLIFGKLFWRSKWIANRYFVMPLDNNRLNQFILCDVERVSSEKQINWKPLKLDEKGRK